MTRTDQANHFPLNPLFRTPDASTTIRGGVVALHGSSLPQRDQPIFKHLAQSLNPLGFVVLSFDRRPWPGDDTPLEVQTEDALQAVHSLRNKISAPVGLFGFSQGAWSASLAASRDPTVAFLLLVGCSGVSPAEQMRFYSDELLRRSGFSSADRAKQLALRIGFERLYRGDGDRTTTGDLLQEALEEPWFKAAYDEGELPAPGVLWRDIDYDPEPAFTKVMVPTLLLYGSDEECVPAAASKVVWSRAADISGNQQITIIDIPNCGHFPAPGENPA
ncbi:MAG TPA: alpha/beta hydrolase, partial [Actinomycetes bacterium]|nr:alpha/beta hydrolase [Actinomycetes bacterium]